MKRATVRDLRYHFRDIEARLSRGEEIEVYKRNKPIGRLIPIMPKPEDYPDFAAMALKIFGKKKTRKTGTEIVSEQREPY
jgi:antitoxin (DNA-binding transcriptional repressor) of toxin-antitoxin stability system